MNDSLQDGCWRYTLLCISVGHLGDENGKLVGAARLVFAESEGDSLALSRGVGESNDDGRRERWDG